MEKTLKKYQLYINGEYVDPVGGEWFDSMDPYRGTAWAQIPKASAADVDRAVTAAGHAMREGPWAQMSPTARGKVLRKLGDLVLAQTERLAALEVQDNGKLYTEMLTQMKYNPEWWYYYGGLADKMEGAMVPVDKPDMLAFTCHEPVGVVAAITAWNSPLLFVAFKCAPALAAGCAVVVKPSEFASASTIEFAALTKEAGLPDGIFNVVTGFGPETGHALVAHPGVAKVTFTGSDATGARIYAQAAQGMKRVSLELGGKSPNIVFEDCDMDAAVSGAVSGIFAATGQTCIAGSRLLVQNSIRDIFVAKLREVAAMARIGDPMLETTNIGPVTTLPQYNKVMDYIAIAKAEGARCILGGKAASGEGILGGQFVEDGHELLDARLGPTGHLGLQRAVFRLVGCRPGQRVAVLNFVNRVLGGVDLLFELHDIAAIGVVDPQQRAGHQQVGDRADKDQAQENQSRNVHGGSMGSAGQEAREGTEQDGSRRPKTNLRADVLSSR